MHAYQKRSIFEEIFENDKSELSYRFKLYKNIDEHNVVLFYPKDNFIIWQKNYENSKTNLDEYDYIIQNIRDDEIEILRGSKAELYINENPIFDTNLSFISQQLSKIFEYNNIKLVNITVADIARIYYDDILNYGNVTKYILEENFIKSLIRKGFVDVKLSYPK